MGVYETCRKLRKSCYLLWGLMSSRCSGRRQQQYSYSKRFEIAVEFDLIFGCFSISQTERVVHTANVKDTEMEQQLLGIQRP